MVYVEQNCEHKRTGAHNQESIIAFLHVDLVPRRSPHATSPLPAQPTSSRQKSRTFSPATYARQFRLTIGRNRKSLYQPRKPAKPRVSNGLPANAGTKVKPKAATFTVERKFLQLVPPEILAHAPPVIRYEADRSFHPQICTSCGHCRNLWRCTSPPARSGAHNQESIIAFLHVDLVPRRSPHATSPLPAQPTSSRQKSRTFSPATYARQFRLTIGRNRKSLYQPRKPAKPRVSNGLPANAGTKVKPKAATFTVERKFLQLVPPEILAHAPPVIRYEADRSFHPQICTSCGHCRNLWRCTSPPARSGAHNQESIIAFLHVDLVPRRSPHATSPLPAQPTSSRQKSRTFSPATYARQFRLTIGRNRKSLYQPRKPAKPRVSNGLPANAGTKVKPKAATFTVERKFLQLVPPEILAHAPPVIRYEADRSFHPQICTSCGHCRNLWRCTSPPARCTHRFCFCRTPMMKPPEVILFQNCTPPPQTPSGSEGNPVAALPPLAVTCPRTDWAATHLPPAI
ncbi:unnamed protein product [Bemisia tabaci]|uniref:Uncharacterized protein n=1 Tax=Bemisia tabaci TaxID=7038 RepID=A0A9P0F3U9_BEMTA|nr:unnamed protein product [Bemisia tabaci]